MTMIGIAADGFAKSCGRHLISGKNLKRAPKPKTNLRMSYR
jgi:hypothetical protein